MKRILFISSNTHAPWGGSEVLWYKTAVFFKKQKKDVDVAVAARKWPHVPRHIQGITDAGGRIYDLPMPPTTPVEYLKGKCKGSLEQQRRRLIQKVSPDLILHSMGKGFEGGDWMQIACSLSVPYCNLLQLASELQWPGNGEVDLYRSGYGHARANFFVSEGNRDIMCRQLGMDIPNASIVRNPIPVSRAVLPYPQIPEEYHLALPAQLVPIHKGQDILFEVLAQEKWKQRPLHLNLYGDGDHSKSLQYYSQYLGLENVHFRGYSTNIEEVWAKNHLLVMSSRMEGLPLTLVEAMSCGRSAVVTGVAGMPECVEDGKTGFVARGAHPQFLDEALERAWQARGQWQEMGKRAAEQVKLLIPFEPVEEFADILQRLMQD